ncbi:MAG: undecaprenyl-diphosphate phosphatase [Acidimicrobiia bacterium]|nr:undecaprenyl-diphosphate phosphatase [Acidimicrobiia bacterium]
MELIRAIVLGVVQGLTEFLPISSSAHLRIVPELFGWPDPGAAFTAVIQLGTMAAVLLYFWSDLWNIARTWLRSLRDPSLRGELEARMGWYLIIATVPIVIFGVLFKDQVETGARDLRLVGTMLIVFGVILYVADRAGRKDRELEQLNSTDGVSIGLAQSLALIPGVSRSGATITAGLFRGFTREAAARFSFLLSVPAVVLSGVYELKDAGSGSYGVGATVVATVLAFVVGYAAIAWFLRFLVNHTVLVFVVYRVALGILVLTLVAAGSIKANTPALGDYLGTLKR